MLLSALHVPAAPSRRNPQADSLYSHRDCKLHSVVVPTRRARLSGFSNSATHCKRYTHLLIPSELYTYKHNEPDLAKYKTLYLVAYITRTPPHTTTHNHHAIQLLVVPTITATATTETFFHGTSYSENCRQSLIEARNAKAAAPRRCSEVHAHFEYSRRHNVFQPERLAPLRPYTSCAVWRATTRTEPRIGSAPTVQLRRRRRCAVIRAGEWNSPFATAADKPV